MSEVIGPEGPPLLRLPNGVRPARDAVVERRRHAPEVLFMARLHPRKRPEAFVEMAALVHRKLPEVRFTLHGADEGSLPAVRQLIAAHRLTDVVSYGGALSYAEALRAYTNAAVYVLPSVDEPFPMTVIEALSAGTPVVCTDTCGMADELARRGAAIVTDGSPQAMAEAVHEVLADENKRDGLVRAGKRAVEEAFSIHAVADRLEELYRNL